MIGFEYNAPRPAQNSLIIEDFTILEDEAEQQPISDTSCSTLEYAMKCLPPPEEPDDDFVNGALHEFYCPPRLIILPATRRYNFRSQPRWKRGRWKSKT